MEFTTTRIAAEGRDDLAARSIAGTRAGGDLCLTCCSSLARSARDTKNTAATAADPKPYRTSCCNRPICASCIARNPRVVGYVPCLSCGEGVGVVSSSRSRSRSRRAMLGGVNGEGEGQEAAGGEVFDAAGAGEDRAAEGGRGSPPPAYEEVGTTGTINAVPLQPRLRSGTPYPRALDASFSSPQSAVPDEGGNGDNDDGDPFPGDSVRTHRVKKGETVRSLATRYNLDPYALIKRNDLPYTSLTTHPGLLQSRREVIVPLSDGGGPSSAASPPGGATREEQEQRRKERMAKRFQLITKETDPWIAKTYVAVHADDQGEGDAGGDGWMRGYDAGKGEKKGGGAANQARTARGVAGAVEMFYADEEWEASACPAGRR